MTKQVFVKYIQYTSDIINPYIDIKDPNKIIFVTGHDVFSSYLLRITIDSPSFPLSSLRADLRMALIDCGILRAITEWLAPLPDKSLPCLPVREAMLKGLREFPSLHTESLKDSGIGKAVMFLLKHPRENRKNKEVASRIINEWSRPIFNLSSNYKGLTKEEREERDYANLPKRRNIESEAAQKRDISKEMETDKKGSRPGGPGFIGRARVPQPSNKDYVVRPKSVVEGGSGSSKSGGKKEPSRFEKHLRNIKDANQRSKKTQRGVTISLEGKKMAL